MMAFVQTCLSRSDAACVGFASGPGPLTQHWKVIQHWFMQTAKGNANKSEQEVFTPNPEAHLDAPLQFLSLSGVSRK